ADGGIETEENMVGDSTKLDKGPPPPSRDVPARIALARISKAVDPIVEAYDKLANAEKILSASRSPKNDVDRAEIGVQTVRVNEGFSEKLEVNQLVKTDINSHAQQGTIDMVAGDQLKNAGDRPDKGLW
ncbi:hypothetical protein A4A49_45046, partial [Nicotiana attenuata]